jgi:hypothetical protein
MKSILDKEEILNFKNLSEQIQEKNLANWGKMNAAQMFQHLNKSVEVIFTDKPIKRMFIGRIIGKMILKKALRNSSPIDKNTPTAPTFIADNSVDFVKEKEQWLGYLAKFTKMGEIDFEGKVHPFFGKMTGHQWNALIYKHVVHHLEQFKVK